MKRQEMTEGTPELPLGDARAGIMRMDDAIRAHVGAVAMHNEGHGGYTDVRKHSNYEPSNPGHASFPGLCDMLG